MGWIVNLMLNSIIGWLLSLLADLMGMVTKLFSGVFGADPRAFLKTFPIMWKMLEGFYGVGFLLCILLFILGIVRNMANGLGAAGEKPFNMIVKFIGASIMVFMLPTVLSMIYTTVGGHEGIFSSVYSFFGSIDAQAGVDHFASFEGFISNILTGSAIVAMFGKSGVVSMVIICVIFVVIGMNLLKLLLEMVERYLLLNMLIFFSPMAASAYTLDSTSKIFSSYLKMYFGQLMMILMNLITCKIVEGGLAETGLAFRGGQTIAEGDSVNPFAMLLLLIAMLKIAQKFDNYMRDIGLTVGVTGGNLTDEILGSMGAVRGMFAAGAAIGNRLGFNVHNPFAKKGAGGAAGAAGAAGTNATMTNPNVANNGLLGYLAGTIANKRIATQQAKQASKSPFNNKSQAQAYEDAFTGQLGVQNKSSNGRSAFENNVDAVGNIIDGNIDMTQEAATAEGTQEALNDYIFGDTEMGGYGGVQIDGKDNIGLGEFNRSDIQNAVVKDGGAVFQGSNGHIIAMTRNVPDFQDKTLTKGIDANGKDVYFQDLTAADSQHMAETGEHYAAYDKMKQASEDTTGRYNFAGIYSANNKYTPPETESPTENSSTVVENVPQEANNGGFAMAESRTYNNSADYSNITDEEVQQIGQEYQASHSDGGFAVAEYGNANNSADYYNISAGQTQMETKTTVETAVETPKINDIGNKEPLAPKNNYDNANSTTNQNAKNDI